MSAAFDHISATAPLPAHLRGGVVAIGNFDGVHRATRPCSSARSPKPGGEPYRRWC